MLRHSRPGRLHASERADQFADEFMTAGGEVRLDGKVAIVTGASAGVGRAYALSLAEAGATVVAVARTLGDAGAPPQRNTLGEVVSAAAEAGRGVSGAGRVFAHVCDMSNEADIVGLIAETVTNHGRIDVLVNNAAALTSYGAFAASAADWTRMLNVNVTAVYLTMREVAPHMIRQGSGSIINLTSQAASMTPETNFANTLVYGVTKAALNRLTYFMAAELAPHGIAVNALSPGRVATDSAMGSTQGKTMPGFKPPTPEVLGPALKHLAVQTADGITGQVKLTDEFGTTWG